MQLRLLGSPVSASASPPMQQAALAALGLEGAYVACDIDADGMREAATSLRAGQFDGANITAPHKQLAFDLADVATPIAEALSASNTWVRSPDGSVVCDNTDPIGFRAMLEAWAPDRRGHALLLGAGGAARSAALVLSRRFERVTVLARDPGDARDLAVTIVSADAGGDAVFAPARWPRSPWTRRRVGEQVADVQVIVSAASLRGSPEELAHFPWTRVAPDAVLLDLVYARGLTPFGGMAAAKGRSVHDGATMLLHQGAASFVRWTGRRAPLRPMRDALARALGRNSADIPMIAALIDRDADAVLARAGR